MESEITVQPPGHTRKRICQPEKWKRNVEKKQRYSAKRLPEYPNCNHRTTMQCQLLTMRDIKDFHEAFYIIPDKGKQDAFILKYCRANIPKTKKMNSVKERSMQFTYTVVNQAGVNLTVCRETFLKVLNITKHRVIGVFQRFKNGTNQVPVETRGGDRKTALFNEKKESVINFITNLKACESHYARGKSRRVYLPSDLNVNKLYKMYSENVNAEFQVKESYFRKIFNCNFNVGFAAPSVDECSTCLELKSRIELEKNDDDRAELVFKLKLHKKQSNCFFEYLKNKPEDCFLMSFDCQKNLVLPKVSDQMAYYSRQLYCYNLSVTKGLSTDSLSPNNVSVYSWMEHEGKKSSNEVASIVFNELKSVDLTNFHTVRLVADGCAGQNKNVNVLCMVGKWLASYAPQNVNKVELIYPITGHSFLPADRVFGLIEKNLKSKNTIICKEQYHEVFRLHGTLKLISEDWFPYNWKDEAKSCLKSAAQLHFKISQCRRISVRKTRTGQILVRGEIGYNLDTGRERSICKVGKTFNDVNPSQIPIGVQLKAEKVRDVQKLLSKHFGGDWKTNESLYWYIPIIDSNIEGEVENNNEEDCECLQSNEIFDESDVAIMQI